MTEKSPSMPFYGKDAYDDEAFSRLTFGGQGLFTWLAWWQWREGSIPADVEAIFDKVPRKHIAEAKKLWEIVEPFFPTFGDGARRRNGTTQKHRTKMLARRERYQDGADSTNARRYPDNTSLGAPHGVGEGIATATALVDPNEIQSIAARFDDRPPPNPTDLLISQWLQVLSVAEVHAILTKYLDKNGAYIDRCVQTRAAELSKNVLRMNVGTAKAPDAIEAMQARIDRWELDGNPRPLDKSPLVGDWLAAFEAHFGFAFADWQEAYRSSDIATIEKWVSA